LCKNLVVSNPLILLPDTFWFVRRSSTSSIYLLINKSVKFTEAISFQIYCDTQDEVDHYWDSLVAGGTEQPCGWLKDKFGVSWQVTPTVLIDMLHDKDAEKAERVMHAMLQMQKIDIEKLKQAAEGK